MLSPSDEWILAQRVGDIPLTTRAQKIANIFLVSLSWRSFLLVDLRLEFAKKSGVKLTPDSAPVLQQEILR